MLGSNSARCPVNGLRSFGIRRVEGDVGYIPEGDDGLYVFASEDASLLEPNKDFDVGGHWP
jgi:hypothetical protein